MFTVRISSAQVQVTVSDGTLFFEEGFPDYSCIAESYGSYEKALKEATPLLKGKLAELTAEIDELSYRLNRLMEARAFLHRNAGPQLED